MNPPWLDVVLADNAHLNLHHPEGRELLAGAIVRALPRATMIIAATAAIVAKAYAAGEPGSDIGPRDVAVGVVDIITTLLEAV